jgi:hypothetical protein
MIEERHGLIKITNLQLFTAYQVNRSVTLILVDFEGQFSLGLGGTKGKEIVRGVGAGRVEKEVDDLDEAGHELDGFLDVLLKQGRPCS